MNICLYFEGNKTTNKTKRLVMLDKIIKEKSEKQNIGGTLFILFLFQMKRQLTPSLHYWELVNVTSSLMRSIAPRRYFISYFELIVKLKVKTAFKDPNLIKNHKKSPKTGPYSPGKRIGPHVFQQICLLYLLSFEFL